MAGDKVIKITEENFEGEVLNSKGISLVDFGASWCGPCQALSPTIDELAEELYGKVKVCKVDVDEAGELAMKYRVMSVPTLIFFKDGSQVAREVGARSKSDLLNYINKL